MSVEPKDHGQSHAGEVSAWEERLQRAKTTDGRSRTEANTFYNALRDEVSPSSDYEILIRQGEALLCGAMHFYKSGALIRAVLFAEHALSLCQQSGDRALTQRALSVSGAMHADMGHISTSLSSHIEAIQLGDEADPIGLARCYVNLGSCLFYASQLESAVACFARSYEFVLKDESHPIAKFIALTVQMNMATIELRREAFEAGLAHVEIAKDFERQLVNDPAARYNCLLLNVHAARLAGALGRVADANQYLARAKLYAELLDSTRATCAYAMAEGALLAATGKREAAIVVLQKLAIDALEVPNLRIDALTELARTLVVCGRRAEAQTVLQELAATSLKVQGDKMRDQLRFLHLSSAGQRVEEPEMPYGPANAAQGERNDLSLPITRAKLHQNSGALSKVTANSYNGPEYELLVRTALFAEIHDDTTGTHCYRVGRSASLLAARLGMLPSLVRAIDFSGRLHDIGKITIPDKVLRKLGVLAAIERQVMEQHTVLGAKLLHNSKVDELDVAEEIALCHHENWDGSGYPHQLEGEAIPISARIVALADVYDALTHHRVYKPAFNHEQAVNMMLAMRGYKFQPELYDEFMRMMADLQLEHGKGLDEFLSIESQDNEYVKARQEMFNLLDAGDGALAGTQKG